MTKGEIRCRTCESFFARCDYCLSEKRWADKNGYDVCVPGSPGAVDQGCTCPIIDNGRGTGSYKGGYIISYDCPLHAENRHVSLETIHECPECNYTQWFVGTIDGDAVRVCAKEECYYWEDI